MRGEWRSLLCVILLYGQQHRTWTTYSTLSIKLLLTLLIYTLMRTPVSFPPTSGIRTVLHNRYLKNQASQSPIT